jgi:deoxyribodipyrimidine photo-lyase
VDNLSLAFFLPLPIAPVPATRIRVLNARPLDAAGSYVLYWMIAARRTRWNFALQRAVQHSVELGRPLVILEPLDVDYPWANDRLHRFILDGMAATAAICSKSRAFYYPYVEPTPRHGRGLLQRLSQDACIVITDHYPAFFIPRLVAAAADVCAARVEAVDSNGLIPLAAHGRAFTSARSFRAFVQRELRSHLREFPEEQPLKGLPRQTAKVGAAILKRWPAASRLLERKATLEHLPIDHDVLPAEPIGGEPTARRRLTGFVTSRLQRYAAEHSDPDADCTSRLSPYLHFGHISAHEVFSAVMTAERWTTRRLAPRGGGAREGWWGVGESANAFLDQLIVWRELAFNGCEWVPDYNRYESLPQWARDTIEAHGTERRLMYDFDTLDAAATADAVWNAAQRQLKAEGWFHGYLRMLWGKKLFEWAPDAPTALAWMEALMNRYSLDGRDPVSYASYGWVMGRYDRPWPRRPIFGTLRYMSSESTRRKLRMKKFLQKYGQAQL